MNIQCDRDLGFRQTLRALSITIDLSAYCLESLQPTVIVRYDMVSTIYVGHTLQEPGDHSLPKNSFIFFGNEWSPGLGTGFQQTLSLLVVLAVYTAREAPHRDCWNSKKINTAGYHSSGRITPVLPQVV